jgi:hypothetical protein
MLNNNIIMTDSREYRATIMEPTATTRNLGGLTFGTTQESKVAHSTSKAGIVNSAVMVRNVQLPTGVDCISSTPREMNVLLKFTRPENITPEELVTLKLMFADSLEHIDGTDLDLFLAEEH